MTQNQKRIFTGIINLMKSTSGQRNLYGLMRDEIGLTDIDHNEFASNTLIVIKLMKDEDYIKTVSSSGRMPLLCRLTSKGWEFESFEKIESEKSQERMKQWYDTENAKQIFEDYPNVKSRSKRSEIISWISLLLAAISIWVAIKFN